MNTGIFVGDDLKKKFSDFQTSGNLRWFQVMIKNEKFVLGAEQAKTDDFLGDYGEMGKHVEKKKACYFVLILENEKDYLLVYYVPHDSSVREKMVYSTSLKNVLSGFGTHNFLGQYHVTDESELTRDGYDWKPKGDTYANDEEKEDYLTEEERMLAIERTESSTVHSFSAGKGLEFPTSEGVKKAMKDFGSGRVVTVLIKVENEVIELDKTDNDKDPNFAKLLPNKEPRFTLYSFEHEFEGKGMKSFIFIYTCPQGSKVKDKMVYSSVKGTVGVSIVEAGIKIAKSIESSDLKELNHAFFMDSVHPKKYEKKFDFKRPKRPGRGGSRRPKKAKI